MTDQPGPAARALGQPSFAVTETVDFGSYTSPDGRNRKIHDIDVFISEDEDSDEYEHTDDCECEECYDGICTECHEEFCTCPNPEMVKFGLEKIYRIGMALDYCDDPEIKPLLEQALELLYKADELNDRKINALEDSSDPT